jgi:biopolymer transport protein ExbD
MAIATPAAEADDAVIAAINTTPLVDVMLVLLIIFLITIPVVNFSVPVSLPKQRNELRESKPLDVVISVDAQGTLYWQDARLDGGTDALVAKLKPLAQQTPQPQVQIRGDEGADYDAVGRVVYACQRAGIAKIGFITEPPPRG